MSHNAPHPRNSRATRRYAYERQGTLKHVQTVVNEIIDKRMGKTHQFTIFRLGLDICAVCQKTRKEHG